jgi:hypothetical protein
MSKKKIITCDKCKTDLINNYAGYFNDQRVCHKCFIELEYNQVIKYLNHVEIINFEMYNKEQLIEVSFLINDLKNKIDKVIQ